MSAPTGKDLEWLDILITAYEIRPVDAEALRVRFRARMERAWSEGYDAGADFAVADERAWHSGYPRPAEAVNPYRAGEPC